jgi:hypothetical protein
MTRQGVKRFGEKVMRQKLIWSVAGRKTGSHFCWPRSAATLLDKGYGGVQKLCKRIIGLLQHTKAR